MSYSSGTQSAAPTVNEFVTNQLLTILWAIVMNWLVASGPIYSQIECTRPPAPEPTTYFCKAPDNNSPFLIIIVESSLFLNPSLLFQISIVIFSGMIKLMICFPVHRGYGLRIAGIGNYPYRSSLPEVFPDWLSIHMTKFMTYYLVKKVSLMVKRYTPSKASWTIPITGALFLGATICFGTWVICFNSAIVS